MRDTLRGRIYRSEGGVRGSLKRARGATAATQRDVAFASVEEAQAFVNILRKQHETAVQRRELPIQVFTKPTVKNPKNQRSTYYHQPHKLADSAASIGLYPGWGFTGLVACHEYVHHLLRLIGDANHTFRAAPSHGSEFARTMLDVVGRAYPDQPNIAAAIEAAYEKEHVLVEPAAQRDAAHKQVLRLRSDILLADSQATIIPMSMVLFAEDPSDYCGLTYKHTYANLDLASTRGNELKFKDGTTCTWRQLRYVEAPMVRVR